MTCLQAWRSTVWGTITQRAGIDTRGCPDVGDPYGESCAHRGALAASAREIDHSATQALTRLYNKTPDAKALADRAVAVLVFPSIVKGRFIIGGQFGDGALRKRGKAVAYYRSVAASYGLRAGVQTFGYILFFMDAGLVQYLDNSAGWELDSGPSLVVLDEGFGKVLSTTTLQKGVYAFIFTRRDCWAGSVSRDRRSRKSTRTRSRTTGPKQCTPCQS